MEGSKGGRKIVLVADDDADDCLLIKDALTDNGLDWMTRFVGDGIELMEYLENCRQQEDQGAGCLPDLILLDLNMPRKGGREALREINVHSRFNKIPIVILTTSDEPQDVALCSSLGAKLFITKPSMYTDWLERVSALKLFV
jgi:CheY-like chemotaxis protein